MADLPRPKRSVCVAGIACVDLSLLGASPLPHPEALEEVSGVTQRGGGIVTNSGAALCQLGGLSVEARACIGQDVMGDSLLREWEAMGMDTSKVRRRSDVGTMVNMLLVGPDGRFGRYTYPAINKALTAKELLGDGADDLARHDLFLFGYPHRLQKIQGQALAELCQAVASKGVAVALDCNVAQCVRGIAADGRSKALEVVAAALPSCAVLHANGVEAAVMTGVGGNELVDGTGNGDDRMTVEQVQEMCRQLLSHGLCMVLLTLGPSGAVVATGDAAAFKAKLPWVDAGAWANRYVFVAARQLQDLPVTVGAGDSFTAGVIAGLLEHGSEADGLLKAAKVGSAASYCRVDGGGRIRAREEAVARWEARPVSAKLSNPHFAAVAESDCCVVPFALVEEGSKLKVRRCDA